MKKLLSEDITLSVEDVNNNSLDIRMSIEEFYEIQDEVQTDLRLMQDGQNALLTLENIDANTDNALVLYNSTLVNIGLEEVSTVSNEDIKGTFYKVLEVLKKVFYKLINGLKRLYVVLFKNAKLLNKDLNALRETINNKKDSIVTEGLSEMEIKRINKLISSGTMINKVENKKELIAYIKELLYILSRYKGSSDATKAISTDLDTDSDGNPINSAFKAIEEQAIKEAAANELSNQLTLALIKKHSDTNKDVKEDDIKAVVTVIDTNKIGGMVTDGKTSTFVKYDIKGESIVNTDEFFTQAEILGIIVYINSIEDVMETLIDGGKEDIKAAETLYKTTASLDPSKNSINNEDLNMIFKFVNTVVPNVANSNVISYYNNVRNIIALLKLATDKLEDK